VNPDHIIIAGSQKCGTSTLFEWLATHPEIGTAIDASSHKPIKELHFFGGKNWPKGFDWYASQFPHHSKRSLDATPEYLTHANVPMMIAKVFPRANIIVTLREPISRAMSQHNHYLQQFPQTADWDWRCPGEDFAKNVSAELEQPFEPWRGIVGRGLYAQQLLHWSSVIPRSQLCVVILEEWQLRPIETLRRIFDFLCLERICPVDLKPHHQQAYIALHDPLVTIDVLTDLYKSANDQLFNWLGREIPAWQKYYSRGN